MGNLSDCARTSANCDFPWVETILGNPLGLLCLTLAFVYVTIFGPWIWSLLPVAWREFPDVDE